MENKKLPPNLTAMIKDVSDSADEHHPGIPKHLAKDVILITLSWFFATISEVKEEGSDEKAHAWLRQLNDDLEKEAIRAVVEILSRERGAKSSMDEVLSGLLGKRD